MSKKRPLQSMAIVIGPCWINFLFTKIEEDDIGNIWLQQDCATCHKAEATLDILRLVFGDCIISRRADVVWPARSCDLIPLNDYLWGAVKDKCYADKPEAIVYKNWKGGSWEHLVSTGRHYVPHSLNYTQCWGNIIYKKFAFSVRNKWKQALKIWSRKSIDLATLLNKW